MPIFRLPEAVCVRANFGEVSADPDAGPWRDLAEHPLRLNKDGTAPAQGTGVRFGWNAQEIRILFVCEDTLPWATFTERDAPLYKEEVVEVFLDTEADGLSYYEFEVNPNNAVLDGCMRRVRSGFKKNFHWRCAGLRSAVMRLQAGWAAEFGLPFESLCGGTPPEGARWRVNFTRIDRPKDQPRELSSWSPTGLDQFHIPERFGWLTFA